MQLLSPDGFLFLLEQVLRLVIFFFFSHYFFQNFTTTLLDPGQSRPSFLWLLIL